MRSQRGSAACDSDSAGVAHYWDCQFDPLSWESFSKLSLVISFITGTTGTTGKEISAS